MGRVLVVRSVHHPSGNATVGELMWLLGRIRPDVVFLEHAPSLHPRFMNRTLPTLEAAAILGHLERHAPQLVPVDAEIDAASIKQDSDALLHRLAALSLRYEQLDLLNAQQTAQRGFVYLNSPDCASIQLEIEREMVATVQAASDPGLTELHRKWLALHDERETAMIRGVEEFARESPFLKAVLLVGAAHGPSLYSRVNSRAAGRASAVSWEFDWPLSEDLSG